MNVTVTYNAPRMSVDAESPSVSISTGTPIAKEYVDRDPYEGNYDVTPTESAQTLATEGLRMTDDLTVEAIPADYVGSGIPARGSADLSASGKTVSAPSGYYAEDASKSVADAEWHGATQLNRTPTLSVDANGLVTSTIPNNGSNTTPIKTSGWADKDHLYPMTVSGSNTLQLETEAGKTVTPTESAQTAVAAGKFTTGAVNVDAIPSNYVGSAIPQKASADLTASGKTVTAPAGYYAADASKSVSDATWLAGKTIETDPSISVDGNGLVTASYLYSTSMKPLNATGWADKNHSVSVTVKGSATHQLPVKDSSDLTVNDDTVSAPAGYYPDAASKAVPAATWKNASAVSVVPEITVDSGGMITANASGWTSIHPLTVSGYADADTAANIQLAGSRTNQLDTLGATTYTPAKGDPQIIPAGKFLTGAQTISPIPDSWYDMSGDLSWMGKDAQLVSSNFYSKVDTVKNTLYNGWTPSTTAKAIVASVTLNDAKFTATDVDQWAYYIFWECGCDVAYTGSPTLKALPTFARALIVQCLMKRPSSFANIQSVNCDATTNQAAFTSSFLRYYGTTTGSLTYTWAASYGFYFGATAPGISSTTAVSPTITPKTPTLNARTSTTYMSTTSANAVDQDNSKWWIKGTKIYKARRECYSDGFYRYMCGVVNSTAPTA